MGFNIIGGLNFLSTFIPQLLKNNRNINRAEIYKYMIQIYDPVDGAEEATYKKEFDEAREEN